MEITVGYTENGAVLIQGDYRQEDYFYIETYEEFLESYQYIQSEVEELYKEHQK